MKGFNDYKGTDGIDKIMECAPYISEILSDTNIIDKMTGLTWMELGATVYKAHEEACNKLFEVLDRVPENSMGLIYATAQIMAEIFGNKDILDFFTSTSRMKNSATSAMENIKAEQ